MNVTCSILINHQLSTCSFLVVLANFHLSTFWLFRRSRPQESMTLRLLPNPCILWLHGLKGTYKSQATCSTEVVDPWVIVSYRLPNTRSPSWLHTRIASFRRNLPSHFASHVWCRAMDLIYLSWTMQFWICGIPTGRCLLGNDYGIQHDSATRYATIGPHWAFRRSPHRVEWCHVSWRNAWPELYVWSSRRKFNNCCLQPDSFTFWNCQS